MDSIELNQEQLELIQNPIFITTLMMYQEAKTPSELAKILAEPANKIHYRSKKLYDLGLLKVVEQTARSKKYQAVAKNFDVPKNLEAQMGQAMLISIENSIDQIKKDLINSMNSGFNSYLNDVNSSEAAGFWLADDLPGKNKNSFQPFLQFGELKLPSADYDDFSEDILKIIKKYHKRNSDDDNTKQISFAFVIFQNKNE